MLARYQIISKNPLWVRKEPSHSAKAIGIRYTNEIVNVSKVQDNFLRIPEGWISEFSADGKTRLVVKMDAEAISVASAKKTKSNDGIMTLEDELGNSGFTYDSSIGTISGTEAYDRANRGVFADSGQLRTDAYSPGVVNEQYLDAVAALNITKLNGIMGMPYQWMPHVDPRIRTKSDQSSGEIGRVYSERVIARMPLLVIAPGEPEFLAGFSSDEKKNVLEAIVSDIGKNVLTTGGESELDRLLGDEGKYYSFRYAGNKYFQYLNPMLNTAAILMDIGDYKYNGYNLSEYNWQRNYNDAIYNYWTGKRALAFYIDSENQISDSFSNEDTSSALASKVNSFSDMAREVGFLLGGASAATSMELDALVGANATGTDEMGQFIANSVSAQGSMRQFLTQIAGGFRTVLAGGKLIFPNIWSDSSFSRSYDINFKFVSPDYDKFSWYLNILVPICHLLCLTVPRSTGPNGFVSPFLVRAFYKGLFNCDMGLVTNLNISKGSEGGWTRDGLPTVVNVTMSIKDLYGAISITETDSFKYNILGNSLFMDYLSNLCGININEPDLMRTAELYWKIAAKNRVTQWPYNVFGAATDTIMNLVNNNFSWVFTRR